MITTKTIGNHLDLKLKNLEIIFDNINQYKILVDVKFCIQT